jgi:YesN/AraC family two-component response regulator
MVEKQESPVDLLITDVVMPSMNGKELAEYLQSVYPSLKVLFMSGYTSDVVAGHGILEKGFYFIQKPFSGGELAVKTREILGEPKTVKS